MISIPHTMCTTVGRSVQLKQMSSYSKKTSVQLKQMSSYSKKTFVCNMYNSFVPELRST